MPLLLGHHLNWGKLSLLVALADIDIQTMLFIRAGRFERSLVTTLTTCLTADTSGDIVSRQEWMVSLL